MTPRCVSREIDASDDVLATLFAPDDLDALRGQVRSLRSLRVRSSPVMLCAPPKRGPRPASMSFPLPRARAVGGRSTPATGSTCSRCERDGSRAGYVMADAEVLDVDGETGGPLGAPDDLTITLAVDHDAAVGLAAALEARNRHAGPRDRRRAARRHRPVQFRGASVRARGRKWLNPRSRLCSRPKPGSRSCTGTSPTTAVDAFARSSSNPMSRSRSHMTFWSRAFAGPL